MLVGVGLAADGYACGDKFLVVGRGVKYGRTRAAVHAASILIVKNAASPTATSGSDAKLEENLKQAGHKVRSVSDPAALNSALKAAQYDLVLADLADSPGLEKQVGGQASKPVVVPVLYQPTADELAAAKKEYGCALKAPSKDYLATIDEIMTTRQKGTGTKPGQTK